MSNKFLKPKIAIIEDDPDTKDMLHALVKSSFPNVTVSVFENPKEALREIAHTSVNIVLTDINMPHMSGEELTHKLLDLKKGIQVIIITGEPSFEVAMSCFSSGAAYFLEKPVFKDHLVLALQSCLNRLEFWKDSLVRSELD